MHFAIIHGNFKAFVIKLEEYLTKKQPQRKTKERERESENKYWRQSEAMSSDVWKDPEGCWEVVQPQSTDGSGGGSEW